MAELELGLKDPAIQKEQVTVRAADAALELSELRVKAQELDLKMKAAEKDLRAAMIKLGDVTVDTSKEDALEAKVGALMEELYSAKSDLEAAQKRAADYQSIAKSNEEQLTELTAASTEY